MNREELEVISELVDNEIRGNEKEEDNGEETN